MICLTSLVMVLNDQVGVEPIFHYFPVPGSNPV